MQGGRTLIIVGAVILVLVVIGGAALLLTSGLLSRPTVTPTPEPEDGEVVIGVPEGMQRIVVAAQDIKRGNPITKDNNAVILMDWPAGSVPEGALTELESAYGRVARTEIAKHMPVLGSMLTDTPGELAAAGSDAALFLPSGKVAYAMPVARWSSVAWAIQPGDHVDVLISLLIVDIDVDFQTEIPNVMELRITGPEGGETVITMDLGRMEALPDGTLVMAMPSEDAQRPRLITQLVIQDALVLRVGDWKEEKETPTPTPTAEEGGGTEGSTQTETVTQKITPGFTSVTLGVTPQDAVILKYLEELGASIDLVLRSASDAGDSHTTEAVTLDYVFERYAIEVPPKLPYGATPPISRLHPLELPLDITTMERGRRGTDFTVEEMTFETTTQTETGESAPAY
jgi:Flp pilus assembly protein CpaB